MKHAKKRLRKSGLDDHVELHLGVIRKVCAVQNGEFQNRASLIDFSTYIGLPRNLENFRVSACCRGQRVLELYLTE